MRVREKSELDPSQLAVAEAPVDERLLVTAAAGQGKTEVVLARLEHLAAEGTSVFDDVLVLSFSRAAVDAVRRRTHGAGIPAVRVRTFDSLASEILAEFEARQAGGFGRRVREATRLLEDGEADYSHIEHVIVDEAQDLVGDRAEFVLALLRNVSEAGFTVLGDPLQAIYDFQLESDNRSAKTSDEFAMVLETELGAERVSLERHYRAKDERMENLIRIGDALRARMPEGDPGEAHRVLDAYRESHEGRSCVRSSLDALSGFLEGEPNETTAVLGATNYAVLRVSEELHSKGYAHSVRRRMQDFGYAPWIARVFNDTDPRRITREQFEELFPRAVLKSNHHAWANLKNVEGDHNDFRYLDLKRLSRRMRILQAPPGLMVEDGSSLVLSTVHRAKGLEFDHVIDLIPPSSSKAGEQTWSTLRHKYVASSRARESLFLVPEPTIERGGACVMDGRWIEYGFRGKRRYTRRFELLSGDVDAVAPRVSSEFSARTTLDVLSDPDMIGKDVLLQLDQQPDHPNELPTYRIELADGTVIGSSSHELVEFLDRRIVYQSARPRRWPKRIEGGRILSVETVASDLNMLDADGPYRSGFWLIPRLGGLASNIWDKGDG